MEEWVAESAQRTGKWFREVKRRPEQYQTRHGKLFSMSTNMKKLAGKVAVVTGASKGIGASIAKYFAAEGAAVVVNYASSKAGADKVVADITGKGGKAIAVQADVSKEGDIKKPRDGRNRGEL